MVISGKTFAGRTYVMAIINITPDSFWADSRAMRDDALFAAEKALWGAAVLTLFVGDCLHLVPRVRRGTSAHVVSRSTRETGRMVLLGTISLLEARRIVCTASEAISGIGCRMVVMAGLVSMEIRLSSKPTSLI